MNHSKSAALPKKPHPDFPLFPHQAGYWAKKVKGKLLYFGKIAADPKGEAALKKWLDEKDALLAGRKPRAKGTTVVLADVINQFLHHKEQFKVSGELSPRTWDRYEATGKMLAKFFGRDRPVDDFGADDFQALRADMARRWGPVALGNEIQNVRSIFRFKKVSRSVIDDPEVKAVFKKPSALTLRKERAKSGPRLLTADEIRRALEVATPNMAAMILLGINGGLGNTDLGELPLSALDLKGGWLIYPRPKTGIPRRIPLWKETLAAIRKVIDNRREPKDEAAKKLLFIGNRGENYAGGYKGGPISKAFQRTLEKAGFNGRTFYDLRRTFRTITSGAKDLEATRSIMGHSSGHVEERYIQAMPADDRLRVVVNHVRGWLFAKPTKRAGKAVANDR